MQLQIQDFGYQDFILVQAAQNDVLDALKTILTNPNATTTAERGKNPSGIVMRAMRLLNVKKQAPAAHEPEASDDEPEVLDPPQSPYQLHEGPAAAMAGEMLTTERGPISDPATAQEQPRRYHDDIRVSIPRAAPDWTLIEYREQVSGMSLLAKNLSVRLHGKEVLYFRRSGDIAHDIHFDFHVYDSGHTMRRVLCHSTWPHAEDAEEWWEGTAKGRPTRYELESFDPEASEMDMLDEVKQEAILAYLGLSYDHLFRQGATKDTVLLSRRDGGSSFG